MDNCNKLCSSFPVKYEKKRNIFYLNEYKKYSKKIHFFAQNESQLKLIKNHFGKESKVSVIGMRTGEKFELASIKNKCEKYDIVYHGLDIEAKGINYVVELAKLLPSISFFIPSRLNKINLPRNIIHENVTWNTGLKDIVVNAKLVLNPSIWSAPVEGALLKSIYYNGNVAGVYTKYGFINDIPDNVILKLSIDIQKAKKQIEDFFNNGNDLKKNSKIWIGNYLDNKCKIEKLFVDSNN